MKFIAKVEVYVEAEDESEAFYVIQSTLENMTCGDITGFSIGDVDEDRPKVPDSTTWIEP